MDRITVASLNIKFDSDSSKPVPIPKEGAIPPGSKRSGDKLYSQLPWAERRSRLVDALVSLGHVDILGFQEVIHNQLLDIQVLLGAGYSHVGVGRDDGKQGGEYSPIFYDNSKYEMLETKTLWLSPSGEVGTVGWDAVLPRIATFLSLKAKDNGELVFVVCTHYDHVGLKARANSSLLLREKVYEWVKEKEKALNLESEKAPVIFMGDLNSPPEEEGYLNLTSTDDQLHGFTFLDSFTHLQSRSPTTAAGAQSGPSGPAYTFSDFSPPGVAWQGRIDFVMLAEDEDDTSGSEHRKKARGGWQVEKYACMDNFVDKDSLGWTGRFSDHRIVRVELTR